MSKCLYCYQELEEGQVDFHPACARRIFGTPDVPILPYSRENLSELARQVIRTSTSVTGVQAKMSLDIDRGGKIFILKPQTPEYRCLPELEDLTMKMAEAARIRVAPHSLIRFSDGELGYITRRLDRDAKGHKISMLDLCQLTNRLTEHKYEGTYPQLADTIRKYSSAPMLDVQRFWEIVIFSWITGNSDMHCKNFSLIDTGKREYILAPAYDLLSVLLADPNDEEEMAMTLTVGGRKAGFGKQAFLVAMEESGLPGKTAEMTIRRMVAAAPSWLPIIDQSFLPDDLKIRYKNLIDSRLARLNQ